MMRKLLGGLALAGVGALIFPGQGVAQVPGGGSSLPPWLEAAIGDPGAYNASYVGAWAGQGGMTKDPPVGDWNTRDAGAAGVVAGIAGNTKRVEVAASRYGNYAYGGDVSADKRRLSWTTYSINYYRFLATRNLPVAPYLGAGIGTGKGRVKRNGEWSYNWVTHWNLMAGVDLDVLPYEGYTLYAEGRRTGMNEKLNPVDDSGTKYEVQTFVFGVKAWFTPESGGRRR